MKMLIDWCPICKETLKDFEIETRVNHDKKNHLGYFTAQTGIKRNNFFRRNDLS